MPTPIEAMRIVAARLEPFGVPFAFLGGAVVCLLVDNPELTEFRPTKDVDVIVKAVTYREFSALEERLRAGGFLHDTSEGAPICRWIVAGCRVDIMPSAPAHLGMNTKWFPEALQLSEIADLGDGLTAKVISPALFLATKIEAFKDRGKNDYYGSHDIEDIITLIDGRAGIIDDVASAPDPVCSFIALWFRQMLKESDFMDAFPGHISPMMGARQRASLVMGRMKAIAELRPGPSD